MGVQNIITDDLTGNVIVGIEPTTIEMDGKSFAVYLSDSSKETLTKMFNGEVPLLRKPAKKAAAKKTTGSNVSAAGSVTLDTYGYVAKDVRKWAKENKVPNIDTNGTEKAVGDVGRLTQNVYDGYKAAQEAS